MRSTYGTVALILVVSQSLTAQSVMRIKGRVLTQDGSAIVSARVQTDAIRGVRGNQFAGQRQFRIATDKTGRFVLLGIERGLWIFEFTHPRYLPHVVSIPISMMKAPGLDPQWVLSVELQDLPATREDAGRAIQDAADALMAGDAGRARQGISRFSELDGSPEELCAAGDLCLLLRRPEEGREFFSRAARARSDWYRPPLGIASAAMMQADFDSAVKAYWQVRDLTKNADLKRTVSMAVGELQLIARTR